MRRMILTISCAFFSHTAIATWSDYGPIDESAPTAPTAKLILALNLMEKGKDAEIRNLRQELAGAYEKNTQNEAYIRSLLEKIRCLEIRLTLSESVRPPRKREKAEEGSQGANLFWAENE